MRSELTLFALITILFTLLLPATSSAQVWAKIYRYYGSGEQYDLAEDVIQTAEGDFAFSGGGMGHLAKVDSLGNLLWARRYPRIDRAISLAETNEGHFLILAIEILGPQVDTWKYYLLKTNPNGELIMEKRLENAYTDVSILRPNNDGSFSILSSGRLDIIDGSGNLLRQIQADSWSNRFTQLSNDNFVLVLDNGLQAPNLIIVSAQGEVLYSIDLPGARSVADNNGDYFVTLGYLESENTIFLAKFSLDGALLWKREYPDLPARLFNLLYNEVVVTEKDDIAFIGYTDERSTFIAKTDKDGQLICARAHQAASSEQPFSKRLITTRNDGFLIGGAIVRQGNDQDAFLVKTDSLCQTGEFEYVEVIPTNPDTVFAPVFSFRVFPNPTEFRLSFEVQPTEPFGTDTRLAFYDLAGRIVLEQAVTTGAFDVNFPAQLPGGLYLFRFLKGKRLLGTGKVALMR